MYALISLNTTDLITERFVDFVEVLEKLCTFMVLVLSFSQRYINYNPLPSYHTTYEELVF